MNNSEAIPEAIPEANKDYYINKITLEYLVNPSIHIKTNNSNELLNKDIKFYKKRICQITKDMSCGDFINNNLESLFNNYASQLIYYFKQIDYEDINQKEYNDLDNFVNNVNDKPVLPIIKDINISDPILRNKGIKKN
jgi:hypothetical protein